MPRRIFFFGLSVFGILWGFTALAEKGSHLLATAIFWLVLTMPMLLWAYISASSDVKAAVSQIQNALVRNEVRVIQIKSHEMLDFEEGEDEGACYAFQLDNDNNEVVFISGQDYYRSSRFPNSDFCLNQILDNDGKVVEELISKRGRKLEPLRTISTGVRLKLRVPDHLEVIRGRLENLEAILANDGPHSARSNSPRSAAKLKPTPSHDEPLLLPAPNRDHAAGHRGRSWAVRLPSRPVRIHSNCRSSGWCR